MAHTITITLYNDDGDEETHELPAKFEVCSRCEGHGTHLNPSIGEHAYSVEEFNESFDDEERAEYFKRGGIYDVRCEECGGEKVTAVADEKACEHNHELKALLERWHRKLEDDALYEAERRHEQRMGY